MRILFISRAFPPITGGIENQNAALAEWLPKHAEVTTVANRFGKKFLPLFLPFATLHALFFMSKYDILLLGDGVLSVVGWLVKIFYGKRKRVACVTHGLDLTYPLPLYRWLWVKHFIPSLDQLIAVGNETIRQGVARGIPESKFVFVPNGVDTDRFAPKDTPRETLASLLKTDLSGKRVLFTGGRLVKRKGVAWFIRNVLPNLPENILYAVSGDGPDRTDVEAAINESKMAQRVFLLGYVTDDERETLLNTCDIFIQPNIPVNGDMEGFGLVVLEAASSGIPVIVSRLEGLKDAIQDGKNGRYAEPEDPESFKTAIAELLALPDARTSFGAASREYTKETYHWNAITRRYVEVLEMI